MSTAALDRQIRPIYDALDTGSNKSAIVACNKLLKKHPKNELVKALKALALVRSQKVEESLVLCDEVLEEKPTSDAVLTAMMHVLRGLGRHNDMVTMFEEAYKQQPTNEELGVQTFFANVRANHWKSAQQIATRMHKQFQEDRYLYWSVISSVLQAKDASTPKTMRTILYKLAHRMITSSPTPPYLNADRFHLHLSILSELELFDEARKLLDSEVGRNICATSLSCNEVRRELWKRQGLVREEGERAEKLIKEKGDRNWLEFLAVLDATFDCLVISPTDVAPTTLEDAKKECATRVQETRVLFTRVAEEDGSKDRSGLLALLELEKRARDHGVSEEPTRLVDLMERYFNEIGDKVCCFEDLKPYTLLGSDEHCRWIAFLERVPSMFSSIDGLRRFINAYKFLRHSLTSSEITADTESARVALYAKKYMEALPLGSDLPTTELQPADDLVLLAGNTFISLWKLTEDDNNLFKAASLLEFALTKSKQSFLVRLMLIRVYRLLGAPSLALEHYRAMHVKQVQHDTLSHLILSRASTFSLAAMGDLTLATECLESTQIYLSNSQETGDFVVRAFTGEKYSQIPQFILFEDRLENSLQRDTVKVEHLRMRLTHEPITSDIIDMELIELKFIFDRTHHDNRDFDILPSYQPRISPNLNELTLLLGRPEGHGWLSTFLQVYIRAFQQSSDLDDTVEEKLLIGDRPKQTADYDRHLSLRERLCEQNEEYLKTLTSDELAFVHYARALADWLEPYHDYTRPPPAAVLAEAAKQTELKTGHPLKGIDIPPNGASHGQKKDEEPPAVRDPPELVVKHFEKLKMRFEEVQSKSPVDVLHVATLAQEAYLLFIIESLRFKPASVVKVNKLGGLVSSFKCIRTGAISVLKEISSELIKRADFEGTSEGPKCFIGLEELDPDFVLGLSKKVIDARKKVFEGVGKGLGRITADRKSVV